MTDDYAFTLEANTRTKYNAVTVHGCPGDTTKFTKACQHIIELAKMDKELNLIWKDGSTIVAPDIPLAPIKER